MRVLSAGEGYRYLLKTVAAGDGDRDMSSPLTRYYAEKGTPPGRWLGSGLAGLGGTLDTGEEVTEKQLRHLLGQGRDPLTGEALGRAYPAIGSAEALIESGVCRQGDGFHHYGLELDRCQFPEATLSALAVVDPFDPSHDREAELVSSDPGVPVEDVLLQ